MTRLRFFAPFLACFALACSSTTVTELDPEECEDCGPEGTPQEGAPQTDPRIEWVWIEPGRFTMGDGGGDRQRHEVEISRGFWMSKYEITQAQFEQVMGYNPSHHQDPGSANRPVEDVSWHVAMDFAATLAAASGVPVDLATEAEWEYAARAGTTGVYYTGSPPSCEQAHTRDCAPSRPIDVGSLAPNPWGLHDLYGNAWEWVKDWWSLTYYAESPYTDPQGPETGEWKVLRGMGFYHEAALANSTGRGYVLPEYSNFGGGIRLVVRPAS